MAAFDLALSCVRDGTDDLLLPERINQLARAGNHLFRDRVLTPGDTLRLFVQQVAQGNIACSAVRHLAVEINGAWHHFRSREIAKNESPTPGFGVLGTRLARFFYPVNFSVGFRSKREGEFDMRIAIACIITLIMQSMATGCSSDTPSANVDVHSRRIVEMQATVRSTALETIKIEEAYRGKPLALSYTAYIGPHPLEYSIDDDGAINEFLHNLGIEGHLALHVHSATINDADIAILAEAIQTADQSTTLTTYLFVWRDGRWKSDEDLFVDLVGKYQPQGAAEIRQMDAEVDKQLEEKRIKRNAATSRSADAP